MFAGVRTSDLTAGVMSRLLYHLVLRFRAVSSCLSLIILYIVLVEGSLLG
jgi:hypothetical protein